jgi:flagellar protein FliL
MARPTKSKDAKPKADAEGGSEEKQATGSKIDMNLIIMAVIIILCSSVASAASVFFLAPMVIKPLVASHAAAGEGGEEGEELAEGEEGAAEGEEGEHGEGEEEHTVGPVIDLEEFTVNLKDPGEEHYLRADLSISVTAEDPNFEKLSGEAIHKWEEEFNHEMAHYVPAIRDIVISSLTSKTSTELASTTGKDQLKLQIKDSVNTLFAGKRKVIRVNFENFIIQ